MKKPKEQIEFLVPFDEEDVYPAVGGSWHLVLIEVNHTKCTVHAEFSDGDRIKVQAYATMKDTLAAQVVTGELILVKEPPEGTHAWAKLHHASAA